MPKEVLDYLNTQRVGVLAVEMLDGSPHGATVHFAHQEEPFVLYFETSQDYRKAEPILKKGKTRATFVVGVDENNMKSLQLDGEVCLIKDDEKEIFYSVYFEKYPEKKDKRYGSAQVLFKFTPSWWRYTDWRGTTGKTILTSN